jgi:pyruvate-formate lyase-activating enzyme
MPRLLLINPPITDVAAFDLWAWPLGLLYWAAHLRQSGFEVDLIDCTDRAHPALEGKGPRSKKFHTGKYYSTLIEPQPEPAQQAGRLFRRYGLSPEAFERELDCVEAEAGTPDAALIASRMTYWYPGVVDAIKRVHKRWPSLPIALGGVYATLCPDHASVHAAPATLLPGDARESLPRWLAGLFPQDACRVAPPSENPDEWSEPALDLCHAHGALPLLTSVGCPFHCTYCASKRLAPRHRRRSPEAVFRELQSYVERWATTDFAFYDDALLVDAPRHFEPFLDQVIASGLNVRFHTPNGIHCGMLTPALAEKMRRADVATIRLSLETDDPQQLKAWRREGGEETFLNAVRALHAAGYQREDIGAYIMAGVPGQTEESVRKAIETAHAAGAVPKLNE